MIGFMDATAGLAIGSRNGLGRVKHIDTVFLWAQEVVLQVVQSYIRNLRQICQQIYLQNHWKPKGCYIMFLFRMGYNFVEGGHHLALDA